MRRGGAATSTPRPAARAPARQAVDALPACEADVEALARRADPEHAAGPLHPADLVVIVGAAELGPCGTAATRFELELDGAPSVASVGELAWMCGLVAHERDGYRGRWIDAATRAQVPESALGARYAAAVAARIGVRPLQDDATVDADGLAVLAPVSLPAEVRFDADSEEHARTFAAAGAQLRRDPASGTWQVILRAGTQIRVPRTVAYSRRVAGQLPAGLDLGRFGIPGDLLASADRMALVNLACTTEAFAAAGLTPEELLGEVHPALVASTQGCGMGGMASLRRLLLDGLLDSERQADRLQESLGNVVAAHAVQSYVGSYGPMVHPVAACATAAISLEEAHDKIRAGKALAVLAGGFDDLTPEGLLGFGDMGATASSDELEALGIAPHEASRANDVRRRGFVEAQGGGALLVVRGDVALTLGLPVRGVLAYASSHADGVQASIPSAGMGVLAAALGGARLAARPRACRARPRRRRHRRRLQARHVDADERPQRGRPARAHPGRARPHARQPAARRLAEDRHRPRQGRRRRVAGGGRAADDGARRRAREPQPRERRPAAARRRLPDARRSPDRPRRAGADPRRARHEPRLRPRLGAAGDRPPRQLPRGRPRATCARTTCAAPAAAAPKASSSACAPGSGVPQPVRRATAASAPTAMHGGGARGRSRAADRRDDAAARRRHVRRAVTTLAVGLDIVTTTAFAEQLADPASGFVGATFTRGEQRAARGADAVRAQRLAARFAAKEAFVKAWSGARAGRPPALETVDLREIEVVDDGHGRPSLRLHGAVAAALEQLAAELDVAAPLRAHLSLSHDPPTAAAVVVLSLP